MGIQGTAQGRYARVFDHTWTMAEWQSGYATVCTAVYVGSTPASASPLKNGLLASP